MSILETVGKVQEAEHKGHNVLKDLQDELAALSLAEQERLALTQLMRAKELVRGR